MMLKNILQITIVLMIILEFGMTQSKLLATNMCNCNCATVTDENYDTCCNSLNFQSNLLGCCKKKNNFKNNMVACCSANNVKNNMAFCCNAENLKSNMAACCNTNNIKNNIAICCNAENLKSNMAACCNRNNVKNNMAICCNAENFTNNRAACCASNVDFFKNNIKSCCTNNWPKCINDSKDFIGMGFCYSGYCTTPTISFNLMGTGSPSYPIPIDLYIKDLCDFAGGTVVNNRCSCPNGIENSSIRCKAATPATNLSATNTQTIIQAPSKH